MVSFRAWGRIAAAPLRTFQPSQDFYPYSENYFGLRPACQIISSHPQSKCRAASWRVSVQACGSELPGCPQEGARVLGGSGPVPGPLPSSWSRTTAVHLQPHFPLTLNTARILPLSAPFPVSTQRPREPYPQANTPTPYLPQWVATFCSSEKGIETPNIAVSVRSVTFDGKSIFLRENLEYHR